MAQVNEAFELGEIEEDSESNDELENKRNGVMAMRKVEENKKNNDRKNSSSAIPQKRFGSKLEATFDTRKLTQLSPTPIHSNKIVPVTVISPTIEEIELALPTEVQITKRKFVLFRRFIPILICISYISYIIAVIIIHSEAQVNNYWCDGDGFLYLLTLFVLFMIFYFKGFKPIFGKRIYRKLILPLNKKLKPYFDNWYLTYIFYLIYFGLVLVFLIYDSAGERERLISIAGIASLLIFGFIFSKARNKINWHHVVWGIGLQYILGYIVLNWALGKFIFQCFAKKIQTYLEFTNYGSEFVYGKLSSEMGIFAFKVLSVIFFFSFCIQILYYYGAMQWLVIKLGWVLQVTIGTTACESINAAANIFLGQTEAPLMVKPFIALMTKSELHAIMTGGFATIAGSVMAAYISFGVDALTLLSASVMNAPAALAYSKLFYPEQETSVTKSKDIKIEKGQEANVLHAAIEGVTNAIPLVANIGANLIAVIAFIGFLNAILNWGCQLVAIEDGFCSLSNLFGYLLIPLTFLMGVPWVDCHKVSQLIGTKVMINEFIAYFQLADYKKQGLLTKRSEVISTFALCGFSNLSSIGIVLGGLGAMAPEKKGEMSQIVVRAMIAGNIASFLSACVAGSLVSTIGDSVETLNFTSQFVNITS